MSLANLIKLGFVLIATTLAYYSLPAASAFVAATVLVVAYGRGRELVEFALGPLRIKLQQKLSEADILIDRLRRVLLLQSKAAVSVSSRMNRWGSPENWPYDLHSDLVGELKKLDFSDEEVAECGADLVRYVRLDLLFAILGNHVPFALGQDAAKEWSRLFESSFDWKPDEVERFLETHQLLTAERRQLLEDARWIDRHGTIKDRDQFMRSKPREVELLSKRAGGSAQ
jgi:hypothetical protein